MRPFVLIGIVFFALVSCSPPVGGGSIPEIDDLMKEQTQAWNRGDLDGFLAPYADSLHFIGSKVMRTKEEVHEMYQRKYFNRDPRGVLEFDNLEIRPIGDRNAYVLGIWKVYRNGDTLQGHYTLIWEKGPDGWKIISDHSS